MNILKPLQILLILFVLEQGASAGFFSSFFGTDTTLTHSPKSDAKDVSPDVVIKLSYGEDIYHSSLSTNNIQLTQLSSGKKIKGSVSYNSANKTISFRPNALLQRGKYHIVYKDILRRGKAFFFFRFYTLKKVEFDFEVTQAIKKLVLDKSKIEINLTGSETIHVQALYEDNTTKDVTQDVEWLLSDNSIVNIDKNIITPLKEGTTTLQAKYANKITKSIVITIYREISGYRLPPEPDEALNNSTLLGIDVNNNGIRDDVERKIIETYREPIKITYMMQTAKIGQEILENPIGAALEHSDKMDKLGDCGMYIDDLNISFDILQSVKFYENNMYNTKARVRAYLDYNLALSGGSYGSGPADWTADACSFDVNALLGVAK